MNRTTLALALPLSLGASVVLAQDLPKAPPGTADVRRVAAGTYTVDPDHSQVAFTVNHLGFSTYRGIFGNVRGSMTIDPRAPAKANVVIDIPISGITTTSAKLDEHLKNADFFDAARYPAARFEATSVRPSGKRARISGNLTIKGITRPVVLDAVFVGAGTMMGKRTIGFDATTTIRRSDFGVSYGIPLVPDSVPLQISVAFEKPEG
ncbi:YceI family protein [Rhizorhabdus dicambivorans]|uniref:Polyisoprenoid-binding protein n=1 Tax=Rhizorhabdus dicambivorans TaxID=1850238 RepID=A0A2A4G2P6_9SPHN|nr:YceI family protein [Rhizorhabdus dicambivorans]ATE67296.1 polyisoprenoid-binding protein [Rhizorhabdus dicambivorans]PCE44294.1 polyisoprenoid-binding protein [Rhizorhabdus dicambivorans]